MKRIPVIDLFAGPGGLGEGFSRFAEPAGERSFQIAIAIEKDAAAHRTLELRSFFRQFGSKAVPEDYYHYVRGQIDREVLFAAHPHESRAAQREAWRAALGNTPHEQVSRRIRQAINDPSEGVLIGGPPCQAYSLAGRSRMRPVRGEEFESDHRHFLYKEYLRIVAEHAPAVFVMENVKGLLSATVDGEQTFERIVADLARPGLALRNSGECGVDTRLEYRLIGLTPRRSQGLLLSENGEGTAYRPVDFVVRGEDHGIPQARHRVIIVGVRSDLKLPPAETLQLPRRTPVPAEAVLSGVPPVRSGLSREQDSDARWRFAIKGAVERWDNQSQVQTFVLPHVLQRAVTVVGDLVNSRAGRGGRFVSGAISIDYLPDWFLDQRVGGALNHEARTHILPDLERYLFAACYAEICGRSPKLSDFPAWLLPSHKNVAQSRKSGGLFSDRFRVQLRGRPATTITSHIAKDGHYYIHYDPAQCRSLTVREAARIQTFPDNYFFEGSRTQQYTQIGNAVPPYLALQVAERVFSILRDTSNDDESAGY